VNATSAGPSERRAPASLLLVEDELAVANKVQLVLAQGAGRRFWVWHERTIAGACRMLSICQFRVILLDPTLPDGSPGGVLRRVKRAAPETPLLLLMGDRGRDQQEVDSPVFAPRRADGRSRAARAAVQDGSALPLPGFNWIEASFGGRPYVVRLSDLGDRARTRHRRVPLEWIIEFEGEHHVLMLATHTDTVEHVIARAAELLEQRYPLPRRPRTAL
jgi:hypothetical protein